jgi:hypothetical protein
MDPSFLQRFDRLDEEGVGLLDAEGGHGGCRLLQCPTHRWKDPGGPIEIGEEALLRIGKLAVLPPEGDVRMGPDSAGWREEGRVVAGLELEPDPPRRFLRGDECLE